MWICKECGTMNCAGSSHCIKCRTLQPLTGKTMKNKRILR
jgi:ribosomal protein L40E